MNKKNIAISVINKMNKIDKNLDLLNDLENEDEILEKKENLIIDFEELDEDISEIEDEVINLKNNEKEKEIKTDKEEIEKETIKEEKTNSNKNFKTLFAIVILILLSIFGIVIYKNLPKAFESEEEITVADPNNFRISDIKEDDEDKAFEKLEDIKDESKNNNNENIEINNKVDDNLDLEKNIKKSKFDNYEEEKNKKEYEELDRAIAELEGNSGVNEVSGRKHNGLAFFKKEKENDKEKKKERNNSKYINLLENRKEKIDEEINRKNKIAYSFNDFVVQQGSLIPAIFLTEVNTDLPGSVLAQVRENIYDSRSGEYLLIPKGTKIYGRYESNVDKGQTRVFVVWDKLSLPNGKFVELTEFQSADALGNSGVNDKTNNHTWSLIGNSILSSVLNFTDTLANGVSFSVGGVKLGLNGQSKEEKGGSPFKEVTSHLVRKEVERQPTITIRRGYKFNIIVNGDLELEKYKY
ncbi:TrbI/VirB10 family protein [Streptobacillus moniliformis]|uniref:Conjugation TrbI family protein n=1 Tax=Streptobacillus moniliformis (strain ATCC 14647 / DSM 12112 / NCTC 10651 / 9901) TaxID=519441 RepID=D1AYI6_STRM9|nr:TrbI/VirB10 family protein [Streptobacillus moniliformis]ACZ01362.1 conjugation TrbI family protein [Streptobacillus moniliformis DSM 12112]AVL43622.1 conjugal transfer protein TrbI [Streptobacillus moniliformis]SQA13480.1 Type IV secretion system protein virB10 [Streptobacillus moniliformis]